ncbi:MAG TPA: CinA family protein [Candidatus Limnocylindria bacterium]|nr:CinA family protein [Candidatus Limnocylindria bacterium]
MTLTEAQLADLAARLGAELLARGWRLATAESSTGGLIGHAITMVPGASRYYVGGVIAYSNQAKEVTLGVPHDLLVDHGAVSAAVAGAMAEGAADRFGVEVGLAVTGVAGPDGGSEAKPVGTHQLSVVVRGHPPRVERHVYAHDRDGNRTAAALDALTLALDEVRRLPVSG